MPQDTKLSRILLVLELAQKAGFLDKKNFAKAQRAVMAFQNDDKEDEDRDNLLTVISKYLDIKVLHQLDSLAKCAPLWALPQKPVSLDKSVKHKSPLSPVSDAKQFGRYKILNEIGRGGMGVVYAAYDPNLKRTVALKTLSFEGEGTLKKRFLREARVTASLKHPGIVPVYEVGFEQGFYYFTMEYIQGKDLSEYILDERPELEPRLIMINKIADALGYAHSKGIIHRDIKPSNILITSEGEPRLTDFGLAKRINVDERLTLSGAALGTPAYMSPEQALGKWKEVDFRSDVYSLGAVLYETLIERPPFGGLLFPEYVETIQKEDPIPPRQLDDDIPLEVEAICLKCLEKDPVKRYSNASELAFDLNNYLKGKGVSAHKLFWINRLFKKAKKHRIFLLYVASAAVLFFVLLTWQIISKTIQIKREVLELYKVGHEFYKKGQYAQAREALQGVISRDRTHEEALGTLEVISNEIKSNLSKAEEKAKREEWKQAIEIYQDILRKDPKNITANAGREVAEARLEAFETYQLLEKENALRAQEREQKERRARALIPYEEAMEIYYSPKRRRSELLKCIELLSDSIQKDPEFADAYFQRGRIYHRLSYLDNALSDYKKCTALNSNLFAPKYYQARIWYSKLIDPDFFEGKNQVEENILQLFKTEFNQEYVEEDRYREILQAFLVFIEHHIRVLDRVKCYFDAFQLSEKLRKNYPLFPEAHFLTAEIAEKLVSLSEVRKGQSSYSHLIIAFEALGRALELDPYNGAGYARRGSLYCSLWDFENALKDLDMALKLNYMDKETYLLRSLAHMILGNHKACIMDINDMIEMWGEKNRGQIFYMYLGCYEFLYGDINKGESALTRSVDLTYQEFEKGIKKRDITVFLIRGLIYSKMRQKQKAIQDFQELLKYSQKTKITDQWTPIINVINSIKEERFVRNLKELQDPFIISPKHKEDFFSFMPLMNTLIKKFPIGDKPSVVALYQTILNGIEEDQASFDFSNNIFKETGFPISMPVLLYSMADFFYISMQDRLCQIPYLFSVSNYYIRACYYFARSMWKECREDLEAALDMDNCFAKGHYALAMVLAILSEKEPQLKRKALFHLKRAIELGWDQPQWPLQDAHFKPLYKEPQFLRIIQNPLKSPISLKDIEIGFRDLYDREEWKDALRYLNSYRNTIKERFDKSSLPAEESMFEEWNKMTLNAIMEENEETLGGLVQRLQFFTSYWVEKSQKNLGEHYAKRGDKFNDQGKYDLALKDYKEALKYSPGLWECYVKLGSILFNMGIYKDAISNWQEALILRPDDKNTKDMILKAEDKLK